MIQHMQKTISTTGKAGELDVTYLATLYKDEPTTEDGVTMNGIVEVEARISGDGIGITRVYLCNGQFRPSASASRLTDDENAAILAGAMAFFDEYGAIDRAQS